MEVAWWACGWTRLGKPNSNWEKRWSWGGGVSARAGASRRRLRSTRKPRTLAATTATPPTATPTASGMTAALLDCFWSGDDAFAGGGVAALLGSPGGRTAEFVTTLPPAPAVVLVAGFADDDGLELADAAGAVRDEAVAVILTVLVMVPVEDKVLVTVTARPTVLKGAVFPVRRTHARQHLPKKSTGGGEGGGEAWVSWRVPFTEKTFLPALQSTSFSSPWQYQLLWGLAHWKTGSSVDGDLSRQYCGQLP